MVADHSILYEATDVIFKVVQVRYKYFVWLRASFGVLTLRVLSRRLHSTFPPHQTQSSDLGIVQNERRRDS